MRGTSPRHRRRSAGLAIRQLFCRAGYVSERALGKEHTALFNLASTLSDLGRHGEAQPLQQRVLNESERKLGREHPNTLLALYNLAVTLANLGRLGNAESLMRQAAQGSERAFGKHHPDTLDRAQALAEIRRKLGV